MNFRVSGNENYSNVINISNTLSEFDAVDVNASKIIANNLQSDITLNNDVFEFITTECNDLNCTNISTQNITFTSPGNFGTLSPIQTGTITNANVTDSLSVSGDPVITRASKQIILNNAAGHVVALVKNTEYLVSTPANTSVTLPSASTSTQGDVISIRFLTEITDAYLCEVYSNPLTDRFRETSSLIKQPLIVDGIETTDYCANISTGVRLELNFVEIHGLSGGGGGVGSSIAFKFLNDANNPTGTPGKWEVKAVSTRHTPANLTTPVWVAGTSQFLLVVTS